MPDRDIPKPPSGYTSGWDYNAHVAIRDGSAHYAVYQAWSGPTSHGRGATRERSGSQHGRALFSTRELALEALREDLESRHQALLAKLR